MNFDIKRRDEERAAKFHKVQRDRRVNDAMRDPKNVLGNELGHVKRYCRCSRLIGNVPVSCAQEFVEKGWDYVLTTQDIVSNDECVCEATHEDYPADLIAF